MNTERHHLSWWAPFWAVAAVMAIFAAVYFSGREKDFASQFAAAREQERAQAIELARLNEALAILNSPDTAAAPFARGKVYVNPARGVVLLASNLPPAPPGKMYEMWIVPQGGQPAPAGLFQSAADGAALNVRRGAVNLPATIEVTVENESGANQPTSEPIMTVTAR